ncbi:MAG: NAD(+) synthase, partial [Lentisphaeria bacterium]|nr:NAD(+) synthase [Lentisphaeria bacterium]
MNNFIRLAAAVPELRFGGVAYNCEVIRCMYHAAAGKGAAVVVFPELAVTGCSCGDLFLQQRLLEAAEAGLQKLAEDAGQTVMIVGVPLLRNGKVFNCAAVLQNGAVCSIVAKDVLSNTEKRWFSPGRMSAFASLEVFEAGDCRFGVEIGSELLAVKPPSADLALAGVQVIFNPSAMPA